MSRHREMLRTLVRLGKTPDVIAAEVPMDARNINENLKDDWPIRRRFVEPLETYAQEVFRQAFALSSEANNGPIADAFLSVSMLETPQMGTEAQRAAYVAWLLGIKPELVFPFGAECSEEADEHLFSVVLVALQGLVEEARRATDRSPDAIRYLSTLCHASEVMEGREHPGHNGWFQNRSGFRRGVYVFRPGTTSAQTNKKTGAR